MISNVPAKVVCSTTFVGISNFKARKGGFIWLKL